MKCTVLWPTYITTYQFCSTTHTFNYSSTNPLILPTKNSKHSYIHSLKHSISHIHTFTHSCSRSLTHSFITTVNQPHTNSFTNSPSHKTHLLHPTFTLIIHSLSHSFTHSFTHSLTYLLKHSLTRKL